MPLTMPTMHVVPYTVGISELFKHVNVGFHPYLNPINMDLSVIFVLQLYECYYLSKPAQKKNCLFKVIHWFIHFWYLFYSVQGSWKPLVEPGKTPITSAPSDYFL